MTKAPLRLVLPWLQRMDRIGSNGVHAAVVAPELLSVEMARIGQTYQLLIVRHKLTEPQKNQRPQVESAVMFRGVDGQLSEELRKQGSRPTSSHAAVRLNRFRKNSRAQ